MVTKDQRRRQLAREKFERQQQRRVQARSRARQRNIVIASALAVILAGGGIVWAAAPWEKDDTKDNASADASPSAAPTSKAPDPCEKPAEGAVKTATYKKEPALAIDESADYTMKLETTCGDIGIDLKAKAAPHTVNSFDFLVGKGYLDHTKCHRLTDQGIFVLQCGDPKGDGTGGPGYTIPDENLKDPVLKGDVYPAGTVAMANQYNAQAKQGRDTGGSQFFLVYQDSPLPPDYTPFGTIDEAGMKTLKKIADAGVGPMEPSQNTPPNATVVINKATVTKK